MFTPLLWGILAVPPTDVEILPGTEELTWEGDLAARMVAGIDTFLLKQIDAVAERRGTHWKRDTSSHTRYNRSVEPNRERLAKILGVVDSREQGDMQLVATTDRPALVGEGDSYRIFTVRWAVVRGVDAEGLLLEPMGTPATNVIALPDCDWTPEMFAGLETKLPEQAQFARRLAENGCRVLVPLLMNREDTHSGIPGIRMTNQPHREFLYRAAYELGRHIIGYEIQKTLAAVDWFHSEAPDSRIGVTGYGEGGLIAFYAAALDTRIDAAWVSGYFGPREALWNEPIYRNVWSLLYHFGDAEIASLIAPRALVIEACQQPEISGPPVASDGRSASAAPGVIRTLPLEKVRDEFDRAKRLVNALEPRPVLDLTVSENGAGPPGCDEALRLFLSALDMETRANTIVRPPERLTAPPDPAARLERQYTQLVEHTQHLMRESEFRRAEFWTDADATDVGTWTQSTHAYREYLQEEVIGCSPEITRPANPRTRLAYETDAFKGYEVVLDVYEEVFAYGILLIPKSIQEGEQRPVVVCQHGLEGRPQAVADPEVENPSYHRYACRLAERGFVTYAPQNPYIGGDDFRTLVRKAHPIRQSLYSIIVRQHERTLEWLSTLPFVASERIAFYGLSYGGKTAMRIPALVQDYCLSICSADFNEWIWKNVSTRHPYSYLITGEYDMFEFDLGNTFNYAELSWLICPRPFMVERGHHDGVAPDRWVAYEYARTRRRYDLLGIGERTELEVFNGPHTIHGIGTFRFLHRYLDWPEPDPRPNESEAGDPR